MDGEVVLHSCVVAPCNSLPEVNFGRVAESTYHTVDYDPFIKSQLASRNYL